AKIQQEIEEGYGWKVNELTDPELLVAVRLIRALVAVLSSSSDPDSHSSADSNSTDSVFYSLTSRQETLSLLLPNPTPPSPMADLGVEAFTFD
ncbi:hypothetical protein Dimus_018163, partial [Dionaea muscipula]